MQTFLDEKVALDHCYDRVWTAEQTVAIIQKNRV